jgi:hypothetical protein
MRKSKRQVQDNIVQDFDDALIPFLDGIIVQNDGQCWLYQACRMMNPSGSSTRKSAEDAMPKIARISGNKFLQVHNWERPAITDQTNLMLA